MEIGLGYLSLDRPSGTLSGGEAQRTKMIRHLGSSLTDVTYVFDEPTIGLHPHDIEQMNELLLQLRDKGNTVLVVEHKPETIEIADHVVDLGPGRRQRGRAGGVRGHRRGPAEERHAHRAAPRRPGVAQGGGADAVGRRSRCAAPTLHNLQDVDVDIPLGVLVVVTGVAGSGKSSLIHGSVSGRDGVVSVDQTAIKGSRRSNPATYTGLLDPIRKAFAKANGVKPALFSANSEGACPNCNGAGVIYTDLGIMASVATPCELCEGKRFDASVLEYTFGGKDITEVLAMSVTEAEAFFGDGEAAHARRPPDPRPARRRRARLPHASANRCPRCPAASGSGSSWPRTWREKGDVYVLDEPTTGLHLADVENLLGLLDRLVDSGRSVIVIAHHQAVMANADHPPRGRRRAVAGALTGLQRAAPSPGRSVTKPGKRGSSTLVVGADDLGAAGEGRLAARRVAGARLDGVGIGAGAHEVALRHELADAVAVGDRIVETVNAASSSGGWASTKISRSQRVGVQRRGRGRASAPWSSSTNTNRPRRSSTSGQPSASIAARERVGVALHVGDRDELVVVEHASGSPPRRR